MNRTARLHERGQSLWLDNITRELLENGTIKRYIDEYSVTGLTSNPSIFDNAISSGSYNESILALAQRGLDHEEIFFELAIADLRHAADLFADVHRKTDGVDGWVSLEVSPLLAYDTAKTTEAAASLYRRAERPNLFVKIPGTPEGLPAIEESIASGVPVNVTLLFSVDQYLGALDAYLNGIERRVRAGLNPAVASVASLFISRWDTAIATSAPAHLRNELGLSIGLEAYHAYREAMESDRFQRLANAGARMQRLLWASTKTKDPNASDTLYVEGLAAPFTVNTMPDSTLEAFFDHGEVGASLPRDGGESAKQLQEFADAGIDVKGLAEQLQHDGAKAFVDSWHALLAKIDAQLGTEH